MEELPSSELGTKKHWDKTYKGELREFSDYGDVGEVWFGEESEQRVLDWLMEDWLPVWWGKQSAKRAGQSSKNEEPVTETSEKSTESGETSSSGENGDSLKSQSTETDSESTKEQRETGGLRDCATEEEEPSTKKVALAVDGEIGMKHCSVLDLGTGNGHFLIQLAMAGFTKLFGIDYSASAISLARAITTREGYDITFAQLDLVGSELPPHPLTRLRYNVCHDKGTYDAISLTPHTASRDMERYLLNVTRLLEPDGVFVITSCNWTEDELMLRCQKYFSKLHTIPTPTFCFGGSTGSLVTALVLQKSSLDAR